MFVDARSLEANSEVTCDICIVGAGAAGITIAKELNGKPIRVCLVESGDLDFEQDTQDLYDGTNSGDRYPYVGINRLRYFGGTTNHWEGACVALDEIDFEHRPWVEHSGWPFNKRHLDPYYARAHKYLELVEYNYDVDYWVKKSGLRRFPIKTDVAHMAISQSSPPTRFGERYRTDLRQSGNITVLLNANVIDVEAAATGASITGLRVQGLQGAAHRVRARLYVLALGGIENPRLLLASNGVHERGLGNQNDLVGRYYMDHPVAKASIYYPSRSPADLARFLGPRRAPNGVVGSHIDLPAATLRERQLTNARAPFVEVNRYYASEGIESFHALTWALKRGEVPDDLWRHIGNVATDIDMVAEAVSRKWFDHYLFDSAEDGGIYVFDSMMEQTPSPDNRITLGRDRDALGMPKVNVDWRVTARDRENFWRVHEIIAREVGRAGLGRVRLLRDQGERIWDELLNFGHHHMGATRAHRNPARGVVDADLRVHGLANLYVAGSSVFPTGGHIQPTLTIVALAIRLADGLPDSLARL